MVGIILGCSSLNSKEVTVIARVIVSDCQGKIQVLMTCKGLHIFLTQTNMVQLLLLPYWVLNALGKERNLGGGLAVVESKELIGIS